MGDRHEKAYSQGKHDAKEAGVVDELCHDIGKIFDRNKEHESYNAGWNDGIKESSSDTKSSSDNKGSDSDKGKSGCYLTTACAEAMKLPDNCLELSVLRNFRDKILMSRPSGKRAVREYYKIAPEIVQTIGEQNNAQSIWQSVYRDIRFAVSLVLSGDFEKAFKHYQQMTLRLKEKYLN